MVKFKYSKKFRPLSLRSKENQYIMVEFLIFEILFLIKFYFNKELFWLKSCTLLIIFQYKLFVFPSLLMVQVFLQ